MVNKQAVGGFKLQNCVVKKGKESERLRIVLEVEVADLTAGEKDVGAVLQALMNHMTGDTEVGVTVFMNE